MVIVCELNLVQETAMDRLIMNMMNKTYPDSIAHSNAFILLSTKCEPGMDIVKKYIIPLRAKRVGEFF